MSSTYFECRMFIIRKTILYMQLYIPMMNIKMFETCRRQEEMN